MWDATLDRGSLALLAQGYANNWQRYLASLDGADGGGAPWDTCVLTASSAAQAEAYEVQLDLRRRDGLLPPGTVFRVLPDPAEMRPGSGGATLRVLAELAKGATTSPSPNERVSSPRLAGRRILVIHSGGDSRRLPHCSALGKLFARVPHQLPDGRPSSLFDELLVSLCGLPSQVPPGILVASGDVLLLFDHLQLAFARPGVVGVAAAAPAETGTHHGVFVTVDRSHQVEAFLHKPSPERLRTEGALDDRGQVAIDTGLVWLDPLAAEAFLDLERDLAPMLARGVTLNLYGDLLAPLARRADHASYLADASDGPATPLLQEVREQVWRRLRGLPFSVELLDPALFLHFGTTREYLDLCREGVGQLGGSGWQPCTASWAQPGTQAATAGGLLLVNAFLDGGSTGAPILVDSHLSAPLQVLGEGLLASVVSEREKLALRDGVVLDQLPLRGGKWVTRLYGIGDDPKQSLEQGGTFLGQKWEEWLAATGVTPADLWPGCEVPARRTLWEARLYPAGASREESLEHVLWLQAPGGMAQSALALWRASARLSLAESYAQADVRRLVEEHELIQDQVRARRFLEGLEREHPAEAIAPLLGRPQEAQRRAQVVAEWLETTIDPWLPLRGYVGLARATHNRHWEGRAFAALARLVRAHTISAPPATLGEFAAREVTVRGAARVDFGGGWTDTPPYALERGGTVLNAAIALRGELPIVARATVTSEPGLVLENKDIEAVVRPRLVGEVTSYSNPSDPFALVKAALVFRGLVRADALPDMELAGLWGGRGLYLCTSTAIPLGSGLGTSSILGGTILRCLGLLTQRSQQDTAPQTLFDEVLCLEQLITTGGGWQDQIGGLVGGVKLVVTAPGLPQVPAIAPVAIEAQKRGAFDRRFLLLYTGQRRLAKNLLQAIMGRYMARDPEILAMLRDIAQLAREMAQALTAGDLDTFGQLLAQHWEINRRLDPGCSNPFIDDLLAFCRPYIMGTKLAGAGGGGFAVAISRDEGACSDLARALEERYPRSEVRLWPWQIAEVGMEVEVH